MPSSLTGFVGPGCLLSFQWAWVLVSLFWKLVHICVLSREQPAGFAATLTAVWAGESPHGTAGPLMAEGTEGGFGQEAGDAGAQPGAVVTEEQARKLLSHPSSLLSGLQVRG